MRFLLDTHTFLWWDGEPSKLSAKALAICYDPSNELFLSIASLWEIQIKSSLGKLALRLPLRQMIMDQQANGVQILPVTLEHIFALETLPYHHKDPFDRVMIAQAIMENIDLISTDQAFTAYSVGCVW